MAGIGPGLAGVPYILSFHVLRAFWMRPNSSSATASSPGLSMVSSSSTSCDSGVMRASPSRLSFSTDTVAAGISIVGSVFATVCSPRPRPWGKHPQQCHAGSWPLLHVPLAPDSTRVNRPARFFLHWIQACVSDMSHRLLLPLTAHNLEHSRPRL